MSSSISKLIEYSIFPAIALVLGKLIGVHLSASLFGITIQEYAVSLFGNTPVVESQDLIVLTSYSDLFMYVFVASIFTFVLIRSIFLHDSHVKPVLASVLAKNNLVFLIQNSYNIYHSAFISLVFTLIANFLILFNVISGQSFAWVFLLTFGYTLLLAFGLVFDAYQEVRSIKQKPGKYEWV